MAPRRVLAALAACLVALVAAGADGSRQEPAYAAKPPIALVPLAALGHPAPVPPPAPQEPGPQTCAISVERCSTEPCMQLVRRQPRRCDRYPDAVPRMIPVR